LAGAGRFRFLSAHCPLPTVNYLTIRGGGAYSISRGDGRDVRWEPVRIAGSTSRSPGPLAVLHSALPHQRLPRPQARAASGRGRRCHPAADRFEVDSGRNCFRARDCGAILIPGSPQIPMESGRVLIPHLADRQRAKRPPSILHSEFCVF